MSAEQVVGLALAVPALGSFGWYLWLRAIMARDAEPVLVHLPGPTASETLTHQDSRP